MPAPGLDAAREVLAALEEGSLSMEELDQCTDDLLDAVLTLAKNREKRVREFDREAHHTLAKNAARESIVMLKNEEKAVPAASSQRKYKSGTDRRLCICSSLPGGRFFSGESNESRNNGADDQQLSDSVYRYSERISENRRSR